MDRSDLIGRTGDTVRIHRPPPRVFTNALGRNVWMGAVEPADLELEQPVSTDPYNSAGVRDPWARV